MLIDLKKDKLVTIRHATRNLPRQPSPACAWRWHRKGVNGKKLAVVRIGGRIYTTEAAWADFVGATTAAFDQQDAVPLEQRSEATIRSLKRSGLVKTVSTADRVTETESRVPLASDSQGDHTQ